MKLNLATVLAESLMAKHLDLFDKHLGWSFAFDNASVRLGLCSYTRRVISLSAEFVQRNAEEQVRDTILHEIAHVLAGAKAGHGRLWKLTAISIGAKPERCSTSDDMNTKPGRYVGTCADCQGTLSMHRLGKIIKQGGRHTACLHKPNRGRITQWIDTKTGTKIVSVNHCGAQSQKVA